MRMMDRAIIGGKCVSTAVQDPDYTQQKIPCSPVTSVSSPCTQSGFRTPNSRLLGGRVVKQRSRLGSDSAKKLNAAFKSPLRANDQNAGCKQEDTAQSLNSDIQDLLKQERELDQKIDDLSKDGYKTEELQEHIQKLHEYNEMKDIAQSILGQIALKRGLTTKDLYEEYGLDMED